MKETRDRIQARRKELGLSAVEVAEALGVSRATIYRYESDEIEKMPTEVLVPLARVLRTTPTWLLGWGDDDEASPPPADIFQDERVIAIAMAAKRMTRSEKEKLLTMAKVMFPKAFEE